MIYFFSVFFYNEFQCLLYFYSTNIFDKIFYIFDLSVRDLKFQKCHSHECYLLLLFATTRVICHPVKYSKFWHSIFVAYDKKHFTLVQDLWSEDISGFPIWSFIRDFFPEVAYSFSVCGGLNYLCHFHRKWTSSHVLRKRASNNNYLPSSIFGFYTKYRDSSIKLINLPFVSHIITKFLR